MSNLRSYIMNTLYNLFTSIGAGGNIVTTKVWTCLVQELLGVAGLGNNFLSWVGLGNNCLGLVGLDELDIFCKQKITILYKQQTL